MNLLGGAAMLVLMLLAGSREKEKYDDSYKRASDRYSHMSNDDFQREAKKIQNDRRSDISRKAAKAHAMRDEIDERRNQ